MIQGGVIKHLFHEETFPNLVNLGIPRIGEFSRNLATSAASATSNAVNGLKTYVTRFRTGLGQHIPISPQYGALHRFAHGEIWPNFAGLIKGVSPGQLTAPTLRGNYRGVDDNSAASASSAASSAASRGLAKR